MIKIVGLGPGSSDALTIGAVEALQGSKNLYFRTEKHPTVDYLKNRLETFKTCDNYYEEGSSFDEVYSNIAKNMIEEYKIYGELVYAVPGHPLVAERSVLNLINLCNENNIEYKILPAVSFVDAMMDRLQIDPIEGLKIIDAFDIKNQILDKRIDYWINHPKDLKMMSPNYQNYAKSLTVQFSAKKLLTMMKNAQKNYLSN